MAQQTVLPESKFDGLERVLVQQFWQRLTCTLNSS